MLREPTRTAWLGVLLLAGTTLALAFAHHDEIDSATYAIVARNLVEDGTPFQLRYLPTVLTPFHEHPPLWFWALAALSRLAPGLPVGLASWVCALGLGAAVAMLGRALVGARPAFFALAFLALTPPFAKQFAVSRLDAPLTLAFTASVALLVLSRGRAGLLFTGGLVAGLGALVKGPPALGAPVVAAVMSVILGRRENVDRVSKWLWVAAGAALPVAAFLAWDRFALGSAWWDGYVRNQVLASLDGTRGGGTGSGPLYLVSAALWRRFRVGFIFAVLALVAVALPSGRARLRPALALLAWVAVIVLGFGMGSRAYWVYALPALVPLALLSGVGLDALLERAAGSRAPRIASYAALAAGLVGTLLLVAAPFGVAARMEPPCPYGALPALAASNLRAGGIAVVVPPADWHTLAVFSEHAHAPAERQHDLAAAAARPDLASLLVRGRDTPVPAGWERVAVHGELVLLQRAATADGR